ncbi:MerR family transcriptional regulator [Bacillota bacterium Lsc_1132]
MNTGEVAKMLGVSVSTVQRWVKQLELPMDKNDRGHYIFNEDDFELLKRIQEHIQNGVLLHEITQLSEKKTRKGTIKQQPEHGLEKLSTRISDLEVKLYSRADSVASYQLLQHRKEIEELQNQVQSLLNRIEALENEKKVKNAAEKPLVLDQPTKPRKVKKKNIVSFLFGF